MSFAPVLLATVSLPMSACGSPLQPAPFRLAAHTQSAWVR